MDEIEVGRNLRRRGEDLSLLSYSFLRFCPSPKTNARIIRTIPANFTHLNQGELGGLIIILNIGCQSLLSRRHSFAFAQAI